MKIVNQDEYKEIIKNGITVVDFFANWCGPCKMLGPVLETVANDYPNINFVKVDCDEAMQLCQEYGIMSIPAVYIIKDGEVVNNFIGYKGESEVRNFIDSSIK